MPSSYAVGDRVRGRWVLANGKERWFPGRIVAEAEQRAAGGDSCYHVKYDDGDEEEGDSGR